MDGYTDNWDKIWYIILYVLLKWTELNYVYMTCCKLSLHSDTSKSHTYRDTFCAKFGGI